MTNAVQMTKIRLSDVLTEEEKKRMEVINPDIRNILLEFLDTSSQYTIAFYQTRELLELMMKKLTDLKPEDTPDNLVHMMNTIADRVANKIIGMKNEILDKLEIPEGFHAEVGIQMKGVHNHAENEEEDE